MKGVDTNEPLTYENYLNQYNNMHYNNFSTRIFRSHLNVRNRPFHSILMGVFNKRLKKNIYIYLIIIGLILNL